MVRNGLNLIFLAVIFQVQQLKIVFIITEKGGVT